MTTLNELITWARESVRKQPNQSNAYWWYYGFKWGAVQVTKIISIEAWRDFALDDLAKTLIGHVSFTGWCDG